MMRLAINGKIVSEDISQRWVNTHVPDMSGFDPSIVHQIQHATHQADQMAYWICNQTEPTKYVYKAGAFMVQTGYNSVSQVFHSVQSLF